LARFEVSLANPPVYSGSHPRFAGRFVVYRHPQDGDYVVYDWADGSQRRFAAFPE